MIENTLTPEALAQLASLVGQTLRSTTGLSLLPSKMSDRVAIITDHQKLLISGRVTSVNFEGDLEDMSRLEVNFATTEEIESLSQENAHYFFFKGELIKDVLLLREQITALYQGSETWKYVSDTGITLCTATGYIKVQRFSHLDEILGVDFSQQKPSSVLKSTPQIFRADLFESYETLSTEHSVKDLTS